MHCAKAKSHGMTCVRIHFLAQRAHSRAEPPFAGMSLAVWTYLGNFAERSI